MCLACVRQTRWWADTSVFEKLRTVVRTEQSELPYECISCGTEFPVEDYHCPECDSYSVERSIR